MLSAQEKESLIRQAAEQDLSASALVRRAVRRELAHEPEQAVQVALVEPKR